MLHTQLNARHELRRGRNELEENLKRAFSSHLERRAVYETCLRIHRTP